MVNKPITRSNCTLEDIYAIWQYNYEITKNLSQEAYLKHYSDSAFRKALRNRLTSENKCCCEE